MNKVVESYKDFMWDGLDWFYSGVTSNEELNSKMFFVLVRNDMGGNKGIHKINENECGRDTI